MSTTYKDYYAILGVDKQASQETIKKRFRKIARKFHPDVADSYNEQASNAKFMDANEAYEVLGDPEKRKRYDRLGANWKQADASSSGTQRPTGRGPANRGREGAFNFEGTGFSEFFEQYFEREAPDGYAPRGRDVETELLVSLEEVLKGSERTISFNKLKPGTQEETSHTFKVKIPKGVREGQRIRLSGQGEALSAKGVAGDLFLRIRYIHHPYLRNEKEKLYYDLEITPWEAVLGASIIIPSLDGPVRIKIPPVSQNQQRLKLRNHGLPLSGDKRGDLYVKLLIEVPSSLTDSEKNAWEDLAKSSKFSPRKE
jgi:curved DNA-binding protein